MAFASPPPRAVLLEDALRAQERLEFSNPEGLQEAFEALRRRPCHDCHPGVRVELRDSRGKLHTRHPGHIEVREDEIALRLSTDLQGVGARRAGLNARVWQEHPHDFDEEAAYHLLVVDDQDEQLYPPSPQPPCRGRLIAVSEFYTINYKKCQAKKQVRYLTKYRTWKRSLS